jgi:hypothetical protein
MTEENPIPTRGRRRRTARFAVLLFAAIAVVLGLAAPASANGTFSTSSWSNCSTNWTTWQYGGKAQVHEQYTATTSARTRAVINSATAWVDHQTSCGPAPGGLRASAIEIVVEYTFAGSGLTCSVAIPAGFFCALNGRQEVVYKSTPTRCAPNVYNTCRYSGGPLTFYPPSGKKFDDVAWMQTFVTLFRPDGNSYQFNSLRV